MDIDDNNVKQDVVFKGDDEEKNDLSITTERDYELMREALGEVTKQNKNQIYINNISCYECILNSYN